jgi:hypothetical protein
VCYTTIRKQAASNKPRHITLSLERSQELQAHNLLFPHQVLAPRQSGVDSFALAQSVAMFAKPHPSKGVRVPEQMDAMATEHDHRLVPISP